MEHKATNHVTETVVRELQALRSRYPDHLSVDYLVDEEGTFVDQKMISALTGKATKYEPGSASGSKLLLVSGPEGFVSFLAGPKRWEDGKEKQGNLGGIIGEIGLADWLVWKL